MRVLAESPSLDTRFVVLIFIVFIVFLAVGNLIIAVVGSAIGLVAGRGLRNLRRDAPPPRPARPRTMMWQSYVMSPVTFALAWFTVFGQDNFDGLVGVMAAAMGPIGVGIYYGLARSFTPLPPPPPGAPPGPPPAPPGAPPGPPPVGWGA
jgi:hypothetical protein